MPVRSALVALVLAGAASAQPPIPRAAPEPDDPKPLRVLPPPREHHTDRLGYPLPPGAVVRLGVPPALSGFAWSLAWTADGRRVVAADWTGVTLLDAATGQRVETQSLGEAGRNLTAPPPQNGRRLVRLAGRAGALYDTASAADVLSFRLPASFAEADRRSYSVCVAADHRFLAGVSAPASRPGVGWRYDLARGQFTRLLADRADLHSLRLAPDARRVYATAGTLDPELTARDIATNKELWTVPLRGAGTLRAISADGRRLAVADSNGVTVFDTANGKAVLTAPLDTPTPPGLWGIDLAPDGGRLAVADSEQVIVWDAGTGKVVHRLPHKARLVAFSPDGRSLLTASAWVQRWDLATGKPAYPMPPIDRPVGPTLLRWSGDGRRLLTIWPGYRKGDERDWRPDPLALWDVTRAEIVWRHTSRPAIADAALDRTGSTVRVYADDRKLRTWSADLAAAGTERPVNKAMGGTGREFVSFLPDGRLAVQGHAVFQADLEVYGPGDVVVHPPPYRWPAETLGHARTSSAVGTVLVRPSGARVDLLSGRARPPLQGATFHPINLSTVVPDTFVAGRVVDRRTVHGSVWESATGRVISDLPVWVPDWANVPITPDGRLIATTRDAHVMLHDLRDPKADRPLPTGPTSALAFSPDGRFLATAVADGTVLIWALPRARADWGTTDADQLWAALAVADAGPAWRALWLLLDHPDRAIAILNERFRPVPVEKDTPDLIARLDHPKYAVREAAARKLADRGQHVEMDLVRAHRSAGSAEQRERLEQLLNKLDPAIPPTGEVLRGLRAVWLLERIGTGEARRLLKAAAGGATGSRVTTEAQAALERLP